MFSKAEGQLIYDQLSKYMEKFLNGLLCGFQENHSTKRFFVSAVAVMAKLIWQIRLNQDNTYTYTKHICLFITWTFWYKAWGLWHQWKRAILKLHYLTNHRQHTKMNTSFSDWYEIIKDVLHRSILELLLFNTFLNIFFFVEKTNIFNFSDDNTILSMGIARHVRKP